VRNKASGFSEIGVGENLFVAFSEQHEKGGGSILRNIGCLSNKLYAGTPRKGVLFPHFISSIISLSHDMSKASSIASSPHSAI
jgi:hypothetical protein